MSYKLTAGWPQHIASGAFANPETNTEYLAWLAEGNTPEPADAPSANAVIDAQIAAIEQANPITHRTQREFMIGVQTMLAGLLGITPAQLLDPQDPNYSHAYAKFVSVNQQTVSKRQERAA